MSDKKEEDSEKPAAEFEAPSELELAKKEAKENYDKWLYLRAEFENFKKRMHKERVALINFGHENFARHLLEVVDSLENALKHAAEVGKKMGPFGEGIELTLKQFLGVFSQHGIHPIEAAGKKFDPQFHEAISQEESDKDEEETILKEHVKGYMIYDRLLRASRVVVAKKLSKKN